jgi:hypothetical protein
MARRRIRVVLVGAGLACLVAYAVALFCTGYRPSIVPPFRAVIRNESSVDQGGLRLTVRKVRREAGTICLAYALEHVECREGDSSIFFRHPFNVMIVHLWDVDGYKMVEARRQEPDWMSWWFRRGWVRLHEAEVVVEDHAAARYVAVGIGRGFTTNRVPLPPVARCQR